MKLKIKFNRKFLIIAVVLIVALIVTGVVVHIASKEKSEEKIDISTHLIEVRDVMFVSNDDDYLISLMSGQREQDYAIDGKVSELVPFGVLVFNRLDGGVIESENITYALKFGENYFTGNMEKSPYDNSYLVDIENEIPTDASVLVTVNLGGGKIVEKTLNCVSNNFTVSKDRAVEIAQTKLKTNISKMQKSGEYEAYVRILKDYSDEENRTYFWYIALIGTDGNTAGILIDSNTEEIVTMKS